MGTHPKLENLNTLLEKGEDFTLTDAQYEKKTGIPLPKDKYYLKNNSALARYVSNYGYSMDVVEKKVILKKEGR